MPDRPALGIGPSDVLAARPAAPAPEILTPNEAAAYLRVHAKTLPALIHRDGLPCSLVGRRRRFRRSELDRWLDARKEH